MTALTNTSLFASLRDEADRGDRQCSEALILTFNADLGFLEAQVLGTARATGAAVTVVLDPRVYAPDPRSVRAAGVHYAVGLVSMPGVFHPKLMVLAGAERVTVAVGSGNLTMSGWHLNDEVLTVASGSRDGGCPPLVRDTASWLEQLPDHVQIAPTALRGLRRTATLLDELVRAAPAIEDGPTLLSNLAEPLIAQLPRDPIKGLRLVAPFHDLDGRCLRGLIEAVQPERVEVAIQERRTVIDPGALQAIAAQYGVEIEFYATAGEDYRHGKALEAVGPSGEVVWTLSGSPNMSGQAMLASVGGGGNCELGVLAQRGDSLFPPTRALLGPHELVPVRTGPPAAEEAPEQSLMNDGLLEATFENDAIVLTFSRPTPAPLEVGVSAFTDPPELFQRVSEAEKGTQRFSFEIDPSWTYPLRLRLRRGFNFGPTHFVQHPDSVTRRVGRVASRKTPDYEPAELFESPQQMEQWLAAVTQLAQSAQRSFRATGRPSRPSTEQTHEYSGPVWDSPVGWRDFLNEASERLGRAIVSFAFGGLPTVAVQPTTSGAPWMDDFTVRKDVTTQDTSDEDNPSDDSVATATVPSRDMNLAEQARYRDWLHKASKVLGRGDLSERTVLASLALLATRMKIWPPGEDAPWFELLASCADSLVGAPTDVRDEAALITTWPAPVRALGQVALYELAQGARLQGTAAAIATYERLEDRLRPLLTPTDPAMVARRVEDLQVPWALPGDPALVIDHAATVLTETHAERSRRSFGLRYADIEVTLMSASAVRVTSDDPRPALAAARWLEEVSGDWVVFASGTRDRRVVFARRGKDLVVAKPATRPGSGFTYRTYHLSELVGPSRIAHNEISAFEKPPVGKVGPIALALLDDLQTGTASIALFLTGDRG